MLNRRGWNNNNYIRLNNLIEESRSSDETEKYRRNYAVADWDNTSAMFDVEDAVFLYQVMNLEFKMTEEEFKEVLLKDIEDEEDLRHISLLTDIISEKYRYLMDLKKKKDLSEISRMPEYKDFTAMMTYIYGSYSVNFSYKVQCYRILYLFKGFTEKELRKLAGDAIDYWMGQEMKERFFEFEYNGKKFRSSYNSGLRSVVQITDLYRTLRENNIDVYICSASSKVVVEEFAVSEKYGYGFKKDEVAGLVIKKNSLGKYEAEIDKDSIQTFLEGKAEFTSELEELYGKAPVLTMGDSSGDYNLLTYRGVKTALIINRKTSGNINELKEKSKEENSVFILQNRDESIGEFKEE